MKKYLTLLFSLFFLAATLLGQPEKEKKWAVGLFSGLYFMQDEAFQEVYGQNTFFLGAEIPFSLSQLTRNLEGVLHFKYMNDKGKTTLTEEETKLQLIYFSLSVRYMMNLNKFKPFLGPGIDYILYQEKYPETFPVDSMNGSTLGFHILGGCYYSLSSSLSLNVYAKYNIAKTTEEENKVNLGGTEWGFGLIYRFNL